MANEPVISDVELSSSLSQLTKSTTAAELMQKTGESRKLKVLSQRKLLDWIKAELMRSLAARADSYSDQEKEEMLQATKASLEERILREKKAERERDRVQAELDQVMAQISASSGDKAQLEQALATLRAQLVEAQDARTDLEQETYELHDELQTKLAMLSTTIAEKDKLRDTVRNQMLRSNALVEGVLGLDATYYASNHQESNPVLEEASDDERFYHDFDVGAAVITTLSQDLEQLRTITGTLGDGNGDQRSLEQDLALLSQVKAGNLHAMDVAAPVSGLVEALAGARAEAEALDEEVASATGGQPQPISDLPDAEGEPGKVLAGATTVVRELAAELARNRQRVAALRNLSEEADAARNATEEELERLRHSHATLLASLAERSTGDIAAVFSDETATDEARIIAVQQLAAVPAYELEQLRSELAQAQAEARRTETLLRAKQHEHDHTVAGLRQQLAVIEPLRLELSQAQTNVISTEKMLRTKQHEHEHIVAELRQQLAVIEPLRTQVSQAQASVTSSEANLRAKQQEHERTVAELRQQLAVIEPLRRELSQAKADVTSTETLLRTKQQEHERTVAELRQQLAVIEPLRLEVSKTQANVTSAETNLRTKQVEHDRAVADLRQQLAVIEPLRRELSQTQADATRAETNLRTKQQEHERTVAELRQQLAVIDPLRTQLSQTQANVTSTERLLRTKQQEHDRVTGELRQHLAEIESLRTALGHAQADARRNESLLQAKQQELDHTVVNLRQQLADVAAAQHRAVARIVVEAARGDDHLTDTAADLALGLDQEIVPDAGYADQVVAAVESLTNRKLAIERELVQAQATIGQLKSDAAEAEQAISETRLESQRFQRQATELARAEIAAREEATTAAARIEHLRQELDAALGAQRAAQAEAESAKADAAEAQAKTRDLQIRHADRIRTDKALAGELLAVTRKDDLLADVSTDLSVALDDVAEEPLREQLQKTVAALTQRQQSLHIENARLGRDSERLRSEVSEANRHLAETQRTVLEQVLQATRGDGDLADSTSHLEWALERMRPGEPLPSDLLQILQDSLAKLALRKQELQSERDEMALSGKEIISALTASRDQRELELSELRQANEEAADRLAMLESRAAAAESANRALAEALARAAVNLTSVGEEARVELELALSQLPDEGEEGIEVPADLAAQIANHGTRVAHALAERQAATLSSLSANQDELRRTQIELDEQRSHHARANIELSSLRKELADVRMLHAGVETRAEHLRLETSRLQQELDTQTRALADANAELDREHEQLLTQNDNLALSVAEIEGCKVRIANLEQQHALAEAEIAEFHARGGATADHIRDDVLALRTELANERETIKNREAELLTWRERTEAAEARAKRLREDFTKRLEERDLVVLEKDRQLDAIADHKTDLAGLQANVAELTRQLSAANARIHDFEAASGNSASLTGRHTNIGTELKRTQADRDLLREQKRSLEADLAEANSMIDELKVQNDERRKEISAIREQVQKALDGERSKSVALNDELGKVRADKIGLEHKLRKLTEGK